jgi:hypothetical protein
MIVAIEGLVPDRRFSSPAAPPVEPDIPDWLRKQQHEPASEEPGDPVASTKTQPAAPQVLHPEPAPKPAAEPAPKSANRSSFLNLDAKPTGLTFDAVLDRVNPIRLSFSPDGRFSGRRR